MFISLFLIIESIKVASANTKASGSIPFITVTTIKIMEYNKPNCHHLYPEFDTFQNTKPATSL